MGNGSTSVQAGAGVADSIAVRRRELLRRRLAEQGLAAAPQKTVAAPRNPDERFPLSEGQQRMWFVQQVDPAGTTLNICVGFTLHGPLDADRLRGAFARVVATHDILRTTYHADPTRTAYQTVAATARVELPV
ncbi:MAG: hypothetical protein ICV72_10830, partial [Aldersonia sp.]|nr:hypothetical protein [Aldersonia sp.]